MERTRQTGIVSIRYQEEIEAQAIADYEEHGYPDYEGPVWVDDFPEPIGTGKKRLPVRIDNDVVEWFKSQGKDYQTRMNAVLRQYMEDERKDG